jgi:hypothetical protein
VTRKEATRSDVWTHLEQDSSDTVFFVLVAARGSDGAERHTVGSRRKSQGQEGGSGGKEEKLHVEKRRLVCTQSVCFLEISKLEIMRREIDEDLDRLFEKTKRSR